MKAGMSRMFSLIIASALLLTLTAPKAVQGVEMEAPNRVLTPGTTTLYLPVVFRDKAGCTTAPTLLSPSNGSSVNTLLPLFRWDNGNNPSATQLEMEVAEDSGFIQLVESLSTNVATGVYEFCFSKNFDPATTYYWRAWLSCSDEQGPYSEVWSFTSGSGGTILPAPSLVAPANGSTVASVVVTLEWSAVSGAVEHQLHWRKAGVTGYTYNRVTGTQATIGWLDTSTTYEWWVTARNDYANGGDSATWQFTTPASAPSKGVERDVILVEEAGTGILFESQDNK